MAGEKFQDIDPLNARATTRARQVSLACFAAIGLTMTLAPVGAFIEQYLNTGSVDCYFPQELKGRPFPSGQRGMTWNTAGKAYAYSREILAFMDSGGNLAMLQEVPRQDYEAYARIMRYRKRPYAVCYVQADAKPKMLQGGLGNMIITDQIPEDTVSYRMKGRSLPSLAKNVGVALAKDLGETVSFKLSASSASVGLDLSFKNLKNADEEDRAMLAFTLKMKGHGGKILRTRGLTGHLTGHEPYASHQLSRLERVIELNQRESRPLIIGFDTNNDPQKMVPLFEKHGLHTQLTAPTSRDGRIIDYIGHSASTSLGIVAIRRGRLRSDHWNVEYRFQTEFLDLPESLQFAW